MVKRPPHPTGPTIWNMFENSSNAHIKLNANSKITNLASQLFSSVCVVKPENGDTNKNVAAEVPTLLSQVDKDVETSEIGSSSNESHYNSDDTNVVRTKSGGLTRGKAPKRKKHKARLEVSHKIETDSLECSELPNSLAKEAKRMEGTNGDVSINPAQLFDNEKETDRAHVALDSKKMASTVMTEEKKNYKSRCSVVAIDKPKSNGFVDLTSKTRSVHLHTTQFSSYDHAKLADQDLPVWQASSKLRTNKEDEPLTNKQIYWEKVNPDEPPVKIIIPRKKALRRDADTSWTRLLIAMKILKPKVVQASETANTVKSSKARGMWQRVRDLLLKRLFSQKTADLQTSTSNALLAVGSNTPPRVTASQNVMASTSNIERGIAKVRESPEKQSYKTKIISSTSESSKFKKGKVDTHSQMPQDNPVDILQNAILNLKSFPKACEHNQKTNEQLLQSAAPDVVAPLWLNKARSKLGKMSSNKTPMKQNSLKSFSSNGMCSTSTTPLQPAVTVFNNLQQSSQSVQQMCSTGSKTKDCHETALSQCMPHMSSSTSTEQVSKISPRPHAFSTSIKSQSEGAKLFVDVIRKLRSVRSQPLSTSNQESNENTIPSPQNSSSFVTKSKQHSKLDKPHSCTTTVSGKSTVLPESVEISTCLLQQPTSSSVQTVPIDLPSGPIDTEIVPFDLENRVDTTPSISSKQPVPFLYKSSTIATTRNQVTEVHTSNLAHLTPSVSILSLSVPSSVCVPVPIVSAPICYPYSYGLPISPSSVSHHSILPPTLHHSFNEYQNQVLKLLL